jgi:hypothetical protein
MFEILSGPFIGGIVECDTRILDVPFEAMDSDLQERIKIWGSGKVGTRYHKIGNSLVSIGSDGHAVPVTWDQVAQDFEASWETRETEEPVNLRPLSEID